MIQMLGTPVREGGIMGHCVGKDKSGKVNTLYLNFTQSEKPLALVALNMDTRQAKTYRAPRDAGAWGSIAASDGCIYLGTYGTGTLYKFDPQKEEIEDLGTGIPGEEYIWDFAEDDYGNIYGGTYGNGKLMKYNLKSGEKTDLGVFREKLPYCRRIYKHKNGKIICSMGTNPVGMGIYDPVTGEKKFVPYPDSNANGFITIFYDEEDNLYARYQDALYIIEDDSFVPFEGKVQEKNLLVLEDGSKVIRVASGEVTIQKADGTTEVIEYTYDSAGAEIFMLHKGPDDKIYGSSVLPLKMFSYDPKTGEMVNLGAPCSAGGEIYSMVNATDRLFTASYGHSIVSVYDPKKPWNFGYEQENNPRQIHAFISHGQNRPKQMCVGPDGNIYIATTPVYGQISGALCRLNPNTYEYKVWRGIVGDDALESVAAIPGTPYICAGSTPETGLGTAHGEPHDAYLLLFDVEKEEVVDTKQPVEGGRMIIDLHYYNGLMYGLVTGGWLFAYDYVKKETVSVKKLPARNIIWPGLHITRKGICYFGGDEKLYKMDLATDQIEVVEHIPDWRLGFVVDEEENKFYCSVKSTLFSIDL